MTLKFQPHPASRRLDVSTNAAAIWLALKNDETPPDAVALEEPGRLLIWRQDVTPMFRELVRRRSHDVGRSGERHSVRRALLDAGDL